jgi:hypothetical protein
VFGGVEQRDVVDAGPASDEVLPGGVNIIAERGERPDAGNYNPVNLNVNLTDLLNMPNGIFLRSTVVRLHEYQ